MVLTFIGSLLEKKIEEERITQEALKFLPRVRTGTKLLPSPILEEAKRERVQRIQQGLPVTGAQMGFFSNIIGIGKKLVGALLGTGARAAAPAARRVAAPVVRAGRRAAPFVGAGAVGLGAGLGLAGDADGAAPLPGGPGVGGNGLTFTRTIVQSVDSRTGEVLRQDVLRGTPHLMNRDLAIAKRVFRLAGKLHRKMPKRSVRVSRAKMLTQQVVENALERAALPCPTKG